MKEFTQTDYDNLIDSVKRDLKKVIYGLFLNVTSTFFLIAVISHNPFPESTWLLVMAILVLLWSMHGFTKGVIDYIRLSEDYKKSLRMKDDYMQKTKENHI